jgi:outer membrane immunogenic protein
MRKLIAVLFLIAGLCGLSFAGPEPYSGKEMKQVIPPALLPECNWTGFYIGLNVGGQFGHSENKDLDGFWADDRPWGYSESGVIAGGQIGYNFQWKWLVLGVEGDLGYMNMEGDGIEPPSAHFLPGPLTASSDSDFYTTIRGRLGVAWSHWLFYGTGGGIGVNYDTSISQPVNEFSGHKQEFNWGYTVGGGIEYMFGCHWSLRAEYLYFALDTQQFPISSPLPGANGLGSRFDGQTEGHIVRAGLNYKF